MYKNIILPASILAGTIIGAGMFSLPFVFKNTGLLTSTFYLALFGLIFISIYFLYADVIIRTPGEHRFVGYAKMYLGNGGFWASLLIGLIQLFFVLTIYLILAPSFSKLFISDNAFYHLLVFWLLGSGAILFNTRRIAWLEFLIVAGILAIIFLIFGLGLKNFFSFQLDWGKLDFSGFGAAGPLLFALSGSLAIPELVSYFRESQRPISFLRKSLALGAILPAIVYWIFVIGILGLSPTVSEDAVSGLVGHVPMIILALMGILGFLSLMSSYIVVGLNTRRILQYDLLFPDWLSRVLVIIVPILLYLIGFQSFIGLVSFVGSLFLPIESMFIIFMWLNANKKLETPPLIAGKIVNASIVPLLLIFIMTFIYALIR